MDDIDSWDPPEVLKKYAIGGFIGYDKEGAPVRINLLPQFDFRGEAGSNFCLSFQKISISWHWTPHSLVRLCSVTLKTTTISSCIKGIHF